MGISKLNFFMEKHFRGWVEEDLKGRHLVIDGYSMKHHLYSQRFDWSRGGQYRQFKDNVVDFYRGLQKVGVIPVVVLDGIDPTGQKLKTSLKRERERIKKIHTEQSRVSGRLRAREWCSITPSLTTDVYVQALMDLGIEYVVVDGEADDALVEIANVYDCPVLSNDSDFYMYKLSGGFIPLSKMDRRLFMARVYHYQDFCKQFRLKDESLRLVIPVLQGNDFWDTSVFKVDEFHAFLERRMRVASTRKSLLPYVQLASLFDSLESFVREISPLPFVNGDNLKKHCEQAASIYDNSKMLKIDDILEVTELRTFTGDLIPRWAVRQYRKGQLSIHVVSMLVVRKHKFHTFVDNITKESCILTSLPIRKCMYGILGCDSVTEYSREQRDVRGKEVASDSVIPASGRPLPPLGDMPRLESMEREDILYAILGCDVTVFHALHDHWRLAMAATAYWCNAVKPPLHLVKSLLLCFLVCHEQEQEQEPCKGFVMDRNMRNSSLWMEYLHFFAQWRACYKDTTSLDEVLMLPLPVTCPSLLYDGELAMHFACDTAPRDFIGLLRSLPVNRQLFWRLLDVAVPGRQAEREEEEEGEDKESPPPSPPSKEVTIKDNMQYNEGIIQNYISI